MSGGVLSVHAHLASNLRDLKTEYPLQPSSATNKPKQKNVNTIYICIVFPFRITGGDGKQEIDWNKSHVYQMIHGQEKAGPKAARYQDFGDDEIQYQGFQDHSKQSRSFQMLSNQVGAGEDGQGEVGEGPGASDF